jgi:hypothetical protein
MNITSISPSSYNVVDECQMKYFIGNVLRIREPEKIAAEKGTFIHEYLEILAIYKKAYQEGLKKVNNGYFEVDVVPPDQIDIDAVFEMLKANFNYKNPFSDKDFKECKTSINAVLVSSEDPRKLEIVETEHKFSLEIDEPWSNYVYDGENGPEKGKYKINGIIDLITKVDDDTYKFIDWKATDIKTPIPTINGWSTMGNLKVGDILFDKDGYQTKILAKSKIKTENVLKITFDDKSTAICSEDHLWTLADNSVIEARYLNLRDKVPVAKPIQTESKDLPIDPYVLGVWLGDGSRHGGSIHGADPFIFQEIERRGYKVGNNVRHDDGKCKEKTIFGLKTQLKANNLHKNKHIPSIYMRASYEQRLDLLRGLMDTDGNVNKFRKQAVFTSCDKKLSNQVKELILSLGQRVNQAHIIRDTCFKNDVNIYPLHFRPVNINPFLLPRKANGINSSWGPGRSANRTITRITKLRKKRDVQCILVDSPSNTFLCTRNMIPTHNSGSRKDWITGELKDHDKLYKDIQLNIYHYCLRRLYPNIKNFIVTIFYTKDGGPFDLVFEEKNAAETLERLKKQFRKISEIEIPKLTRTWKCKKFCYYSQLKLKDAPNEFRKNQLDEVGSSMCACSHLHELVKINGTTKVIQDLKDKK